MRRNKSGVCLGKFLVKNHIFFSSLRQIYLRADAISVLMQLAATIAGVCALIHVS